MSADDESLNHPLVGLDVLVRARITRVRAEEKVVQIRLDGTVVQGHAIYATVPMTSLVCGGGRP